MTKDLTPPKLSVFERRRMVTKHRLQGWEESDIACVLNLPESVIKSDLRELRLRWKREADRDVAKLLQDQLARIDQIEQALWDGWEASKGDRIEEVDEETTGGKEGTQNKKGTKRTSSCGDAKFLQGLAGCVVQRSKLQGIDKPVAIDSTIKIDRDDEKL